MKLKIGEKEYSIKFAYKPTLKERIISRIVKMSRGNEGDETENLERIEDMLLFLPEILLVGLQVYHKEFQYDYDTKVGKKEQLDKAFDLIDKYSTAGGDLIQLFNELQEDMKNDSFLASLFRKEEAAENAEETVQPKTETVKNES